MAEPCTGRVRTRVKICGVTTPGDARLAVNAGADAIGLNFHPPSRRAVDPQGAAAIVASLPPFVTTVGVFVDPQPALVSAVLDAVRLDCLQFHGAESAAFCRQFGVPYTKAAGVGGDFDFEAFAGRYADARALLLDAFDVERRGGTGRTFDWSRWPRCDRPLILAGGLNPDNVGAAITATRPYAVDVASGVEGTVQGRKDARLLARFLAAAANV